MGETARVAVVGSTGFVGSALSTALDNNMHTEVIRLRREDLDLTNVAEHALPERLDVVVIAANTMSGDDSELAATNVVGPAMLAARCREQGVRRLVLLSSGAVYGDTPVATSPNIASKPTSKYAKSKIAGEYAVRDAWDKDGLAVLRLYFPYGPGQHPPRLIPKIADRIACGLPIVCRPDGGPLLSLTHIQDVTELLIRDFVHGTRDGTYNIASDVRTSIEQLARGIGRLLGSEPIFDRTGTASDCISVPYDIPHRWRELDLSMCLEHCS